MTFFTLLWEGIKATSMIEWLAVASSIIYVILAAKRISLCWLFAFIGSTLFVYLCYIGQLYIESFLQLFYVAIDRKSTRLTPVTSLSRMPSSA